MELRNHAKAAAIEPIGPAALAAMLLCCAGALHAQNGMASLHGIITDPSGSVVPGASVKVAGAQSIQKTEQTDAQGKYDFEGLASGVYSIDVSETGFTERQEEVKLDAGQSDEVDVSLALPPAAQQVTVTADSGGATLSTDASGNADALVLDKTDMDALPDDPDDLADDLQALAGPTVGPNGGQLYIDVFTDGRIPPKNSIREIRINQNPFAPQYDHPGQGRIEILTKPGTDDFHGDFLYLFSDASINSRNPFVAEKPPYRRQQWEGDVSGPLGKKTSFAVDFQRRDINENAFVNAFILDGNFNTVPFSQAVVTPLTGTETDFKLDRQLTTNNTLTLRYGFARDTNDNIGVGGFSLPGRAYNQEVNEQTFQFVETAVLNSTTINETRFRFRQYDTDQGSGSNAPVISVLDAFSSGGSSIGSSFDHQNRYELQNFTSRVKGTHTLRWGGLLRAVNRNNQGMQNYAGTFTFTSLDAYRITLLGVQDGLSPQEIRSEGGGAQLFSMAAGNPLATVDQADYGVYFQDDWKPVANLTVSPGLRYEGQTNAADRSDFAPRLGVAWAPGGKKDTKNVIRAGSGIFYDRLSEGLTLNAIRQNGIRQQQFLIENPDFFPMVPAASALLGAAQPQAITETYAGWQAPRLIQGSIGYERQVASHVSASSTYIHSSGTHVLRSRDINAPLPGSGLTPYGGANAIYLYETSGVYRQDQWITTLNVRAAPKLSLNAYYVYGHAVSNTDGSGTFPANQYDLSGELGRAAWDIHHRFQLNGSWTTRWGLRFSPFLTITSGRPYNIITGTDLNGDGLFTDRPAFALSPTEPGVIDTPYGILDPQPKPGERVIPRNLGNGPGFAAANLRVSKIFNLGKPDAGKDSARQLIFAVNARNIFNHPNLAPPDGNLSSPLFGTSTSLINGNGSTGNRRLDLQVRLNF